MRSIRPAPCYLFFRPGGCLSTPLLRSANVRAFVSCNYLSHVDFRRSYIYENMSKTISFHVVEGEGFEPPAHPTRLFGESR